MKRKREAKEWGGDGDGERREKRGKRKEGEDLLLLTHAHTYNGDKEEGEEISPSHTHACTRERKDGTAPRSEGKVKERTQRSLSTQRKQYLSRLGRENYYLSSLLFF